FGDEPCLQPGVLDVREPRPDECGVARSGEEGARRRAQDRGPVQPWPDGPEGAGRRRDDVGLGTRSPDLPGQCEAPGASHRRRAAPAAGARPAARRVQHRRAQPQFPRRARRERARTQSRTRQGALGVARSSASIFSRDIVVSSIWASFPKLDPRLQVRNPVMFIVEIGSVITTGIFVKQLVQGDTSGLWFVGTIAVWLWLTVLFANFAEAIAERRGKAQASALRATRTTTLARRRRADGSLEEVAAPDLQKGDVIVTDAGEVIAADGDVIEGVGSVDE